jgi:hypothetical protein
LRSRSKRRLRILDSVRAKPIWIEVVPKLKGKRLYCNQPAILTEKIHSPSYREQPQSIFLKLRLDFNVVDNEQVQAVNIFELLPDA